MSNALSELRIILETMKVPGTKAWEVHKAIEDNLTEAGWNVRNEVPVIYGGGRGRLDMVAEAPYGETVAIESDAASPRKKSIAKLLAYEADHRVVVLRSGLCGLVSGIAIIGLGLTQLSPRSFQNKCRRLAQLEAG